MPALLQTLALALAAAAMLAGCDRAEPARVSGATRTLPADTGTVERRLDIVLEPDSDIIPGHVPAHTTLAAMLAAQDLDPDDVIGIVAAATAVFDPRKLREGQPWRVERTRDRRVRYVEYEIDSESFLRVTPHGAAPHVFAATVVRYDVQRLTTVVSGGIGGDTTSLFAAMAAEGETPELSMALAGIFAGEVDFNSDLQPGDRFRLVVEKLYRDGRLVKYGSVQAAELLNDGRVLVAVRYAPPGAAAGYYDRDGKSLKRFFLRSPLRFEPQITSRFSLARFHPVLHEVRAHLGVDYRAPVGAPVVAVSAGVITAAGWRGGAGNAVSIRHASGYESSYLHLSSIAAGVRAGAHVGQGQMIGRVGATGLATGPHLDYRLAKNGRFVNPLVEHRRMPPGEPVPLDHLDAFKAVRDGALAQLGTSQAGLELASRGM